MAALANGHSYQVVRIGGGSNDEIVGNFPASGRDAAHMFMALAAVSDIRRVLIKALDENGEIIDRYSIDGHEGRDILIKHGLAPSRTAERKAARDA